VFDAGAAGRYSDSMDTGTSHVETLFVTRLYQAALEEAATLNPELEPCCRATAADDAAGQRWSARHGYPGYTSYASLDDLAWRYPAVKALGKILDRHARAFSKVLDWDLGEKKLQLDSLWLNVQDPGGFHSGHIHPNSVLSGTYYVAVPPGSGSIRFEDPRLPQMMAAPPRKKKAPRELQPFVSIVPVPGTLLLWESWLRHEVPLNQSESERISISFNYAWR
jgi:uncharacterized protein (TIGR02466 family)